MKNLEGKEINSGNIKFKQIDIRKNRYKKITKNDFILAFTFSFLFIFGIVGFQNSENFKADLFDIDLEEIIYDGEKSRTFSPSLSFYPENKVIENGFRQEGKNVYLDYYTLETPDNIIEISLDNITSNPTCSHGWRYKFQGTSEYIKLGETVNESDISIYGVNPPVLTIQDGISANYKIDSTGTGITIYFDKDIKNGKFYDFALEDGIKIYQNYKTLEEFISGNKTFSISGNELKISFENEFKTDFGRIIINENLISDLDGRIAKNKSVIGDKISNEIIIDNKKPIIESFSTGSNILTINFSENILENLEKNIETSISIGGNNLQNINNYTEYNIEGNILKIYFSDDVTGEVIIGTGAVVDKNGNENDEIVFEI